MDYHEIASIFPLLTGADYTALVDDIKENGLIEPIWTHENKIVDGRNRYRACLDTSTEPRFRSWNGKGSLVSFVLSLNLRRRHLSKGQRAVAALDALPFYEGEAKERQGTRTDITAKLPESDTGEAREHAAKDFDVSARYISDAKKLSEEAPDLIEQVKNDKDFTLSEAKKEHKKRVGEQQEQENIKRYETTETKSVIQVADIKTATLESLGLASGADAIITDPPYPREFLPLFGELARFAGDTLKDGGSLLVMSGESHLPEVYQLLVSDKRLRYQWTMCYMTPGPATQLRGRPIASNWKPIIWLTKGKYSGARINDVFENPTQDKRFHHWGQGEVGMSQIIERMTNKGDIVIDPFLGGGTTGVCCVHLERMFYGFDIDIEAVKMARARIAKVEDDTTKLLSEG